MRVQEWVDAASDIHVLVVGGRAAGAAVAVPSDDGHRAAWSPLEVGGTVRWLAEAAVRAVGGDVMAAHLLAAADGRVVVADVDGSPPPSRFPSHVWERVGALVGERVRGAD